MADIEKKPTVQESMQTFGDQNQANIGKVYDAGLAAQKQGLLDAYNANTQAQAQQGQKVAQDYDVAKQDIGVQSARNAGNLTQFANVRGVNTQAGSQHQLNLNNAASTAVIDYQRQQALQENERQKQLMTATYQNQVQAAIADNDYKRAAALLDDYNNNQKWQEQQAQILASYGNFDPYKDLYGDDAAKGMQKVWQAKNPDVAYRTGAISAKVYRQITGRWPRGYNPPSTGGGWWYPGAGSTNDNGTMGAPGKAGTITRGAKVGNTSVAPRSSGNINTTW